MVTLTKTPLLGTWNIGLILHHSATKLLNARLWPQDDKAWMNSCKDLDYEVLIVSQFTLYGIWKGNKPDFHHAMPPAEAKACYDAFVKKVKQLYKADKVQGESNFQRFD